MARKRHAAEEIVAKLASCPSRAAFLRTSIPVTVRGLLLLRFVNGSPLLARRPFTSSQEVRGRPAAGRASTENCMTNY